MLQTTELVSMRFYSHLKERFTVEASI